MSEGTPHDRNEAIAAFWRVVIDALECPGIVYNSKCYQPSFVEKAHVGARMLMLQNPCEFEEAKVHRTLRHPVFLQSKHMTYRPALSVKVPSAEEEVEEEGMASVVRNLPPRAPSRKSAEKRKLEPPAASPCLLLAKVARFG